LPRPNRAAAVAAAALERASPASAKRTSASKAWSALLHGAWAVVHVVERDGRRYLVAHAARQGEGLTPRELVAVRNIAAGLPYKHVAAELGVSSATAGRIALTALRKLGVASRVELASLLGR
jgi:DNA-binding NarL/FixJ family response regulator